jgi:hypothetical protein
MTKRNLTVYVERALHKSCQGRHRWPNAAFILTCMELSLPPKIFNAFVARWRARLQKGVTHGTSVRPCIGGGSIANKQVVHNVAEMIAECLDSTRSTNTFKLVDKIFTAERYENQKIHWSEVFNERWRDVLGQGIIVVRGKKGDTPAVESARPLLNADQFLALMQALGAGSTKGEVFEKMARGYLSQTTS